MLAIINLLYLLILIIFLVGSLIVVFHIIRYSYKKTDTAFMLGIFLVVVGSLIMINVSFFYSIDFIRLIRLMQQ